MLNHYNFQPNKRLGQNFLIDKNILNKIIKTADLSKNDVVLEIGSGTGSLTKELAKKAKKVITIEKDKRLIPILKKELKEYKNIEIIYGDALEIIGRLQLADNYKVIANIPYYITSRVIRNFLEAENQPESMVLLIQKEVAQRIIAKPPKMNLLAVSVQYYAQPKIISYISKNCFWPKPKVNSAVIKIASLSFPSRNRVRDKLQRESSKAFFKTVKNGFSSPRKKLINNLSEKLNIEKEEIKKAFEACNLQENARAQELSIADWIVLKDKIGNDKYKSG